MRHHDRHVVRSGALRSIILGIPLQFLAGLSFALCVAKSTPAAETSIMELEVKIPLGDVRGRIDHLAVDVARQRLFVAELGNNTLGVVDLAQRKVTKTFSGLRAPQGIGYVASTDTLYVANDEDGSVRIYQGPSLTPAGAISLGDDADNVRVDEQGHRVFVGYGEGGLAEIDTASRTRIANIRLKAHPESFRLDRSGQYIFVNVPEAREIAVVDRGLKRQVSSWTTDPLRANFPLVLDEAHTRALAVFRNPPRIGVFHVPDGKLLTGAATCGDADDLFIDAKRSRVYVSCGEGFLDILSLHDETIESLTRIPTVAGARTALFVPELDRLFIAVRAAGREPAAIWVFRPAP
jgi:hypothetical protein